MSNTDNIVTAFISCHPDLVTSDIIPLAMYYKLDYTAYLPEQDERTTMDIHVRFPPQETEHITKFLDLLINNPGESSFSIYGLLDQYLDTEFSKDAADEFRNDNQSIEIFLDEAVAELNSQMVRESIADFAVSTESHGTMILSDEGSSVFRGFQAPTYLEN